MMKYDIVSYNHSIKIINKFILRKVLYMKTDIIREELIIHSFHPSLFQNYYLTQEEKIW